ncbi:MAG TPA: glycosyltransferase family A protein [Candidatus Binataceae bacterium]|nr:glycosyltransferase family A protein [Candidatus Binataceae bacterium]
MSVIVPTYQRRAMVSEAIASVLAQREVRLELIVIDDGSTDGTWNELGRLVSEQTSDRPIRIERTNHVGVAGARNRAAAIARAPWLAFLDSDDLWHPEKLARQLEFMRASPRLSISQTQEIWIRGGRRINPARRHIKRAGDIFVDSLALCLISASATIISADLFRDVGRFDEDFAAAEDYDLWLRILVDREVGLLDEYLVTRRAGHPGQLSSAPALDRFRILALLKLLGDERVVGERRKSVVETLSSKCVIYARGLARRGRGEEALLFERIASDALKAWRLCPDGALNDAIAAARTHLCGTHRSIELAKQHNPHPALCQ